MVKRGSSLQNVFPLLQVLMAASITPPQPTLGIAHGDLRLLSHGNSFHEAPDKKLLCWCCFGSECCSWGQTLFYALRTSAWYHSVSLCGLPLTGWAIVAPRCFHFTITALTADQGRNLTNWLVRKVASYDGAILKVTDFFSKAILLPMFVYGDCMVVCSILYTCQQQVWL
jgi:hypothetical protein